MNAPNEKKLQLIALPFHIDLDKLRDDAEPKQLKDAPYCIMLESSPQPTVESLIVNQQDSVKHQQ